MEAASPANLSLANDLTYVYHFKCLKLIGPKFLTPFDASKFFRTLLREVF